MKFKKIEYGVDWKIVLILPTFGVTRYKNERLFWCGWMCFMASATFEKGK